MGSEVFDCDGVFTAAFQTLVHDFHNLLENRFFGGVDMYTAVGRHQTIDVGHRECLVGAVNHHNFHLGDIFGILSCSNHTFLGFLLRFYKPGVSSWFPHVINKVVFQLLFFPYKFCILGDFAVIKLDPVKRRLDFAGEREVDRKPCKYG